MCQFELKKSLKSVSRIVLTFYHNHTSNFAVLMSPLASASVTIGSGIGDSGGNGSVVVSAVASIDVKLGHWHFKMTINVLITGSNCCKI